MSCVKRSLIGFTSAILLLFPHTAFAESVLDRVSRTGELVAGTRTDAKPFAYLDDSDHWTGYSIELLEQIRAEVQRELRRPVQLKLVAINSSSKMMAQVEQSQVDLTCGSSSYSSNRDMDIDFSVGYFSTGTKLLIKPDNRLGSEFRIGVVDGTTNQQVLQHHFPIAQFITFENRTVGLEALRKGQIDGLGSDSILLETLRQSLPEVERQNYEVFPATEGYSPETYACMLPQGDAEFKTVVDTALLQFMQAVVNHVPSATAVIAPWFGEAGIIPSEEPSLLAFFRHQVTTYQSILQPPSEPVVSDSNSSR